MNAEIGSVSHGTLRFQDLLPAFADYLEVLDTEFQYEELFLEVRDFLEVEEYEEEDDEGDDSWSPSMEADAGYLIDALYDALNEFAPPYCYFGAIEGDGSDFGFWISEECIREGIRCHELIKVDSYPEDTDVLPEGAEYWLVDHGERGNMTLVAPILAYRTVWSV